MLLYISLPPILIPWTEMGYFPKTAGLRYAEL